MRAELPVAYSTTSPRPAPTASAAPRHAPDSRDETAGGLLVGPQLDLGRLDHGVGGFDHGRVALGLDHPQRFGAAHSLIRHDILLLARPGGLAWLRCGSRGRCC